MGCTTILVGKKASYDGSTLIARNDDSPSGVFTSKKMIIVEKNKNGKKYKSVISKVEIDLPEFSYRYSLMPNVTKDEGVWGACGINECNVAMTATETITSNPRVLGADPLVKKGIGEEDLVVLVLPYISSAKEGVIRLGKLLEQYGTYECNGIAFSDKDSIWYLETIGGHHWISKRVKDDHYVVMPNQFGIDHFDFDDANSSQNENMCSEDLKEFMLKNHLCLDMDNKFSPRYAFGSHDDSDHIYNTPRAWFITNYFNPSLKGQFNPEDDNIPWSNVPDKKITIDDVKYALSSHYQGTCFDPYTKIVKEYKPLYRPIGISRTSFIHILQIRDYVDKKLSSIEWVGFACNIFNTLIPVYTNVNKVPTYLNNTTEKVSTNNFYWVNRIISCLVDSHYQTSIIHIERYQESTMAKNYQLIKKFDNEFDGSEKYLENANKEIAKMIQKATDNVLSKVLYQASVQMKCGFSRSDN